MDKVLQEVQNTIILPVYSTENRRPGTGITADGTAQLWEQAFINCYPLLAKDNVTGEVDTKVVKRPPFLASTVLTPTIGSYGTIANMANRANIVVTQLTDVHVGAWWDPAASKIYILQYRPSAGTTIKIGEITSCTATDTIFISEITQQVGGTYPAGTPTAAIAVSYQKGDKTLGAGYYATSAAGVFTVATLAAIASASFPSNLGTPKVITGPFAQMNGITYIQTLEGTIYGSGGSGGTINDVTLWNTNTISAASQYPDTALGVYRYKNTLVAAGKDSIEFFTDAAFPPPASPLERMDQAFIKFGLLAPKMIINVHDTIYWVAAGSSGALGIWQLEGYTPTKISTGKIDLALTVDAGIPGPTDSLECLLLNEKLHLLLNYGAYYTTATQAGTAIFSASDTYQIVPGLDCFSSNLVYNLTDKIWWGLTVADGSIRPKLHPATGFATASTVSYTQYIFLSGIAPSSTKGTLVYRFVSSADQSYIDATTSGPFGITLQFNTYWFGTSKRKRLNRVTILCDRMYPGGAASSQKMYICYTRDDANLATGPQFGRPVILASTNFRYYINNLGQCRSFSPLIVQKTDTAFRCSGLELNIDQGTS